MQSDTFYTTAAKNMILDKKFLSIIWKVRRLITKPFSCDLTTSEQTEDDVSQVQISFHLRLLAAIENRDVEDANIK